MKLFKEINSTRHFLSVNRQKARTIGFVPTMGALHDGHLSLIQKSNQENDLTVCSIFVNPTQFNNQEDLEKYPRTIENDIKLLLENDCQALFYPDVQEMYPADVDSANNGDYGFITDTLEGHFRPGHFKGVITIVKKLFHIIEPDRAYFGQKDYQQCAVVRELIRRNRFHIDLKICPTMREPDGLAMSSRNTRLNEMERKAASTIPRTLEFIKENFGRITLHHLTETAVMMLHSSSPLLRVEYLEIVNPVTLVPLREAEESSGAVVVLALWCGNVRLIDNMILSD